MVVSTKLPTFKKASDARGRSGFDLVLFGPPGVGKTTLAASAQDSQYGKDVLWFDIDGSSDTLSDREDIATAFDPEVTPNPTWQDLRSLVDQLVAAGADSPYKTLVLDTITTIYTNLIMPKVVGSMEAQPQIQDWGKANRLMLKLIADLRTLNSHGINVIFVGHVREEKEIIDAEKGTSRTRYRLAGSPQGRDEILRTVNNVAYYDWDRRYQNRVLYFRPSRQVESVKLRQPLSGNQIPLEMTNPTMDEVLRHVRKAS